MSDIPAYMTGIGSMLASVAALYSVIGNGRRLKKHGVMLQAVDTAVNGKGPGQRSIGEQVSDLAARIPAQDAAARKVVRDNEPGGDPTIADNVRTIVDALPADEATIARQEEEPT